VLALIESDEKAGGKKITIGRTEEIKQAVDNQIPGDIKQVQPQVTSHQSLKSNPDAFLSPLIISIAQKENLSLEEVQSIQGSGADGRIQKSDVFNYLKNRKYPIASRLTTDDHQPTTAWEVLGYSK